MGADMYVCMHVWSWNALVWMNSGYNIASAQAEGSLIDALNDMRKGFLWV